MSEANYRERAKKEMAAWPPRPGLWAHAQEMAGGDQEKVEDYYIRMRAAEMKFAEQMQEAPRPEREAAREALPTMLPQGPVGRLIWRALERIVSEAGIFNLTIGAFVSVITFTSIFLNAVGSRAWWLLLPLGQMANMYLSYRLTGFPLHLLAPTRLARARLEILMHIFSLTVLLMVLAIGIPAAARFIR